MKSCDDFFVIFDVMMTAKPIKGVMLAILVIALLVAVSCAKPKDCESDSDCPSKACQTKSCNLKTYECEYSIQSECCGNGLQEEIENGEEGNKCTCPADYGECTGKASVEDYRGREQEAQYLEYMCNDENECLLDFDRSSVKAIPPKIFEIRPAPFEIEARLVYNQPFDLYSDTIDLRFELDKIKRPDLLELPVIIDSIEVYSAATLIGEETERGILENLGDVYEAKIKLEDYFENVEETLNLRFIINYEYTYYSGGSKSTISIEHKYNDQDSMVLLKPELSESSSVGCKKSSDCEKKTCKDASCNQATGQCEYEAILNCCGNGIPEERESGYPGNKCTCPEDHGYCKGKVEMMVGTRKVLSSYLEYQCEGTICKYDYDRSLVKNENYIGDYRLGDFNFEMRADYNVPFNVDEDSIALNLELKEYNPQGTYNLPFEIKSVQVKDGTTLIWEINTTDKLTAVGDSFSQQAYLDYQMFSAEEIHSPTIYINYETSRTSSSGSVPIKGDFQWKPGSSITLVKPGVEE